MTPPYNRAMAAAQKPSTGPFNFRRLDALRFARAGETLTGELLLTDLTRLGEDLHGSIDPQAIVRWSARGEWRADVAGASPQAWMHLQAEGEVPLTCQRCLGAVGIGLNVDRWFRFVADEATAEAQDDDCEEDLLALDPKPDLQSVIEDELIMELPLVPMHGTCPDTPAALRPAAEAATPETPERPHPFAALQKLKDGL
jgi:uncharacterized protein